MGSPIQCFPGPRAAVVLKWQPAHLAKLWNITFFSGLLRVREGLFGYKFPYPEKTCAYAPFQPVRCRQFQWVSICVPFEQTQNWSLSSVFQARKGGWDMVAMPAAISAFLSPFSSPTPECLLPPSLIFGMCPELWVAFRCLSTGFHSALIQHRLMLSLHKCLPGVSVACMPCSMFATQSAGLVYTQ